VLVDDRAVAAKMLVERDAIVRKSEQSGQPALAVLDWLSPNVLAVHHEQIERAKHSAGVSAMSAYQFEHCQAIVVADDSFSVDHTRSNGQSLDRLSGHGKPITEVMAIAGDQADAATSAMRQDPKAIMFNLVNPTGARGRALGRSRQAGIETGLRLIGADPAPEFGRY
jgi:hypothetical protein